MPIMIKRPSTVALSPLRGDSGREPGADATEAAGHTSGLYQSEGSSSTGNKPQVKVGASKFGTPSKLATALYGSEGMSKSKDSSVSFVPMSESELLRQVSPPAPSKPALRPSLTGLSAASGASTRSLRARDQPKLRKSQSALSSLSKKTDMSVKSSVPSDLEIGELRGMWGVPLTTQWPIHDIYEMSESLGEGGFGKVHLGVNRESRERFAVKQISVDRVKDVDRLQEEMVIFERLKNPYIVRLHEVFRDDETLYLVMDLCLGGDLMDFLLTYWSDPKHPERRDAMIMHRCKGLPWQEVAPLVWQMLAAIAYLHHHRFAHRDLKLENFMLKDNAARPHLCLVDFGLSVRMRKGEKLTGKVGTLMYMAPEVLGGSYDEKCDIWSIGVCSYILCIKKSPWVESENADETANAVFNNLREGWPDCDKPPELRSLIDKMMTYSVEVRPSAKSIIKDSAWLRAHGSPGRRSGMCCVVS
mmetsp:Transcript_101022/g.253293  ORF Transcript_101022/g.253293 Transcript_101022/m.253293 type:complete len:473 (+) Transcript_101022:76-1494(+)